MHIMQLVKERRNLKAKWQTQKTIWNEKLLNAASENLEEMLKEHNNNKFNAYYHHQKKQTTPYGKPQKKTKRPILETIIIKKDNGTWIRNTQETQMHLQNIYTKYSNLMILTEFHQQKCKTSRNRQSKTITKLNIPLSKRWRRLL